MPETAQESRRRRMAMAEMAILETAATTTKTTMREELVAPK